MDQDSRRETGTSGLSSILRTVFSIDLRALAAFRIVMGFLLFFDLLERLLHVRVYYTDLGILPREALEEIYGSSMRWTSLHFYTGGSVYLQATMLLISMGLAIAFAIGYRTRLVTFLSWILFVSLNRRMPSMCTGADDVLRLMLFWSFFLPLGARWSEDELRGNRTDNASLTNKTNLTRTTANSDESMRFFSMGTVAILLQVCYIYLFTAILKMHPDWLGGEAIRYAMELDIHTRPLGTWVGQQRAVARVLTYATLFAEGFVPLIALSPYWNSLGRIFAILSMWSLHLGIIVCMDIGLFPYVSMMIWILFIPTEAWDWLESRFGSANQASKSPTTEAGIGAKAPLAGANLSNAAGEDSMVVSNRSQNWLEHSAAFAWITGGFLLFITVYNILGLDQLNKRGITIPASMSLVANLTRVDQKWKMYAPTPLVQDGWYIMPAKTLSGDFIDVFHQAVPSYEKPAVISATFPSTRIKKLLLTYRQYKDNPIWPWIARFYAREWNARVPKDQSVARTQVIFIGETEHNGGTFLWPLAEFDVASDKPTELSPTPFGKR